MTTDEIVEENFKGLKDVIEDEDIIYFYKGVIKEALLEFAQYHVNEALRKASESALLQDRIVGICADGLEINKKSILNAYPVKNIK